MKLFNFHKPIVGGVHPIARKAESNALPINVMPIPKRLYVPVQQHSGNPAVPEVGVGDHVWKGQLLAHGQGNISAPVHSPTSGTIIAITPHTAPHPSGLPILTIVIESDGEDRWFDNVIPIDPFSLSAEEMIDKVGQAGIVGMGGATFPAVVKLRLSRRSKVHTFIINGGECEPYMTCDDRLMRERPEQIVDGIRIVLHATQVERALIGIEDNKPEAIAAMRLACRHRADIKVIPVPALYPMGSAQHLIKTLMGVEVPSDGRSADVGALVHNVGTVYAIHKAVRFGQPLVSRVITVSGGALKQPRNIEVPIGTLLSDAFEFIGGFEQAPARVVMGGPMMGYVVPDLNVPIVKGTSGILALTAKEVSEQQPMPCIRCGSCVDACPCGLLPLQMAAHIRSDQLDKATEFGLVDCIACGCCSYVCPSHIPLIQYFSYAKSELADQQRTLHRNEETKKLVELRKQRLDREAAEKAAAIAKRKADAARKKAEKTS